MRSAPTEKDVEALTVAMVFAPGVYARNRMFEFFKAAPVQRARARASMLRSVAGQLSRVTTLNVVSESRGGETSFVLRYAIASMRLTRAVHVSPTELAVLRLLAARAGVATLPPAPQDRALVDAALVRLLDVSGGPPRAIQLDAGEGS